MISNASDEIASLVESKDDISAVKEKFRDSILSLVHSLIAKACICVRRIGIWRVRVLECAREADSPHGSGIDHAENSISNSTRELTVAQTQSNREL